MLNIIKVSQNYVEKWNEESFEPKFLRNIKAGNDIVTTIVLLGCNILIFRSVKIWIHCKCEIASLITKLCFISVHFQANVYLLFKDNN